MLTTAFEAPDYQNCVKDLQALGIDPLQYINSLEKVSLYLIWSTYAHLMKIWWQITDTLQIDSDPWRQCLRALTMACGLYGILPTSYEIPFTLSEPCGKPSSSCSFFNHWRLSNEDDPNQVFAVKSFRAWTGYNLEILKKVRVTMEVNVNRN